MRKRLRLLVVGVALLLLAGLLALWLTAPKCRISKESFEEVQNGMTEAEVEAVLGGPAPWYGYVCFFGLAGCREGVEAEWDGGGLRISVIFFAGRVCHKTMRPLDAAPSDRPPSTRGFVALVRRWFGI